MSNGDKKYNPKETIKCNARNCTGTCPAYVVVASTIGGKIATCRRCDQEYTFPRGHPGHDLIAKGKKTTKGQGSKKAHDDMAEKLKRTEQSNKDLNARAKKLEQQLEQATEGNADQPMQVGEGKDGEAKKSEVQSKLDRVEGQLNVIQAMPEGVKQDMLSSLGGEEYVTGLKKQAEELRLELRQSKPLVTQRKALDGKIAKMATQMEKATAHKDDLLKQAQELQEKIKEAETEVLGKKDAMQKLQKESAELNAKILDQPLDAAPTLSSDVLFDQEEANLMQGCFKFFITEGQVKALCQQQGLDYAQNEAKVRSTLEKAQKQAEHGMANMVKDNATASASPPANAATSSAPTGSPFGADELDAIAADMDMDKPEDKAKLQAAMDKMVAKRQRVA